MPLQHEGLVSSVLYPDIRVIRTNPVWGKNIKNPFDKFLWAMPDYPSVPHYHPRAAGNSIIDQLAQKGSSKLREAHSQHQLLEYGGWKTEYF